MTVPRTSHRCEVRCLGNPLLSKPEKVIDDAHGLRSMEGSIRVPVKVTHITFCQHDLSTQSPSPMTFALRREVFHGASAVLCDSFPKL